MGALRSQVADKPGSTSAPAAKAAVAAPTALERLRARTNYKTDTGYSPLYHAALAELPRLSSGQVCTFFLLMVNMLSYGRPDKPKSGRHVWTLPVTVEELAELCRCHVRDIQRQIQNLAPKSPKNPEGRGLISVQRAKRGAYKLCLLYQDWAKLPDYTSGCKVVSIDEPEAADDDAQVEIEREAVRLVKRPQVVRGGRACRSIPVSVGVKSLRVQHTGALDLTFDAVVSGGQLVLSTRAGVKADGEGEANAKRHGCRDDSPEASAGRPARAGELIGLFDPVLAKSGSRLLIGDKVALDRACKALADMPLDFLTHYFMTGKSPRADRGLSSPKVVASIVAEACKAWRASAAGRPVETGAKAARPAARAGKSGKVGFREGAKREILRRLKDHGGF